mgnify:CR=1 FL=1
MYTAPSLDDLLAGMQAALQNEIMPFLGNEKAIATAAMMQAVVQEIRQAMPVYLPLLVEEHNEMLGVMASIVSSLQGVSGDAADALRHRASGFVGRSAFPTPPALVEVMAAHRELSTALVQSMRDLDVLQRAGETRAEEAVAAIRAHIGPRLKRDAEVLALGGGLVGRG